MRKVRRKANYTSDEGSTQRPSPGEPRTADLRPRHVQL